MLLAGCAPPLAFPNTRVAERSKCHSRECCRVIFVPVTTPTAFCCENYRSHPALSLHPNRVLMINSPFALFVYRCSICVAVQPELDSLPLFFSANADFILEMLTSRLRRAAWYPRTARVMQVIASRSLIVPLQQVGLAKRLHSDPRGLPISVPHFSAISFTIENS